MAKVCTSTSYRAVPTRPDAEDIEDESQDWVMTGVA